MALFSVPFGAVAISVAQDIFSIKAGAANPIVIHEIRMGQKTLTAVEFKELKFLRQTVTVTQGSGGTTPTPVPLEPSSGASGCTAHVNDTTAASAGTITLIEADIWAFLNGYFYLPAPEDRIYIAPGTAFMLNLPTAPSASMTCSGTLKFDELGI